MPIEEKEDYRGLQDLRQSTELLDQPERCVHVDDRESEIHELFCTAYELGTSFLVRTCLDRPASDGHHTIVDEMAAVQIKGLHQVEARYAQGQSCLTEVQAGERTQASYLNKIARLGGYRVAAAIHREVTLPCAEACLSSSILCKASR